MEDPRAVTSHFRFGENWRSFLSTVTTESIREAERGLTRLFPGGELKGCRFLDIGCGSGLSMVAAYRLGAIVVDGIDIDRESIEASSTLLRQHVPDGAWSAEATSVFDMALESGRGYDVVYSWGVLHHTGDVWAAIARAADMVVPRGRLALALYRRTPLCGLWKREKRFYATASPLAQGAVRAIYSSAYCGGLLVTGRNPFRYVARYRSARGMDWRHDVHDWLGGYPYESVEPAAVVACLERLGFSVERAFEHPAAVWGLFGSHCDEYVAVRSPRATAATHPLA